MSNDPIQKTDLQASWPKSAMKSTTVEQVQQQAKCQEKNAANQLGPFRAQDVRAGSYVRGEDK